MASSLLHQSQGGAREEEGERNAPLKTYTYYAHTRTVYRCKYRRTSKHATQTYAYTCVNTLPRKNNHLVLTHKQNHVHVCMYSCIHKEMERECTSHHKQEIIYIPPSLPHILPSSPFTLWKGL